MTQKIPSVPAATDLQSALNAINTLRQAVAILSGQLAGKSSLVPPGAGNITPLDTKNKGVGRFVEVKRTVETQRITNPSDSGQYVDVELITSITMQDPVTGQQWVWKR